MDTQKSVLYLKPDGIVVVSLFNISLIPLHSTEMKLIILVA